MYHPTSTDTARQSQSPYYQVDFGLPRPGTRHRSYALALDRAARLCRRHRSELEIRDACGRLIQTVRWHRGVVEVVEEYRFPGEGVSHEE